MKRTWLINMNIIGKINEKKIKAVNTKSYKRYSTDEIVEYINEFPEPQSNMERSYFQYKCNNKLYGVSAFTSFVRNAFSIFPFFIFLFRKGRYLPLEKTEYIFISDEHKMDIMPNKYKGSYKQISKTHGWLLGKKEKEILIGLWKNYPFSYYFLLKNLIKVANYGWVIHSFKPKEILCSCEYSCTSSFLTEYCHMYDISHVNIMHGYNIVDLKCPFSSFDRMSIWENFFINTYHIMRCGTKKFEIEVPSCIQLNEEVINNDKPTFTYYTQNFIKDVIPTLLKLRDAIEGKGMQFIIRCHPSYPMDSDDKSLFSNDTFEDCSLIDIEKSINRANYVVARNSTVLYQASKLNKYILIDDMSLPEEYVESRKKGAFLWENEKTYVLSQFIKDTSDCL